MNKIYKVKKNTAGNSVACSEFAKGHTKKAVLGSLLIIGALGMATTASAQNNKAVTMDSIQQKLQQIARKNNLSSNNTKNAMQVLALVQQGNILATEELNKNVQDNTAYLSTLTHKAFQNQVDIQRNNESIEDLYAYGEEVANSIGEIHEHNRQQNGTIGSLITNSTDNTKRIATNTKRIATAELGIAENKKDALIAKAQADKNKNDIQLHDKKITNLGTLYNAVAGVVGNNTQGVATNKDKIAENKKYIQGLVEAQLVGAEVMAELNKNVEENKRDLSAVTGKAFQNQIDIQRNNDSIEDLYEANNENVERLIEHGDKIWANEESVQYLNKEVQNNINNIHELAQQQDQHSSDIRNLSKASITNKADADAKFKGVQTDIANNKITLAQHTKKIDDNQRAIEAKLGGKVDLQKLAELKTSVDKNQTDIVKNKADIQDLAKVQQTGVKAIEELNKNVQTNKAAADTKFAATEDAITKNAKDITKNTTSISALDTKVSGFDGRINTLDSKVDTFDGRISALDSKVNTFDGRINALDDKFKNGMAAQAALNGLFQPYSVGKVSISAAIGGYGSKSAIAIGAGYRVNPQLAFKGGTAINMGGSRKGSYNIGVNYEF